MANIMQLVKLYNSPKREGFDLSRKNLFSAKAGELLPVYCQPVLPGDKWKIQTKHFTRTIPLNSAAYARMNEYFDWYFVPTNLLWNKFNTFVLQMKDNGQSAIAIDNNQVLDDQHPFISRADILSFLQSIDVRNVQDVNNALNMFAFSRTSTSNKLLEYLNYGRFLDSQETPLQELDTPDYAMNPFPLLAYQKIYFDHFRDSQWEKSFAPAFNINYMTGASNTSKQIPISNLREDIDNMFELRYANWKKDYFMGVLPNSQYGDVASVNISSLLPPSLSTRDTPFAIRNSTISNAEEVDVYQTSLRANAVSSGSFSTNWYITDVGVDRLRSAMGLGNGSLIGAFSILALRNAEALQKWAEITQSHQQDYKSQIEAHWGVHVSDAYSERSTYIGGGRASIDINAITNQNLDDASSKPIIKGMGTGVSEDYVDFSSDVHGYLMCIYHCAPDIDYSINGIPKDLLKTYVTDYAIPELDHTGMSQVTLAELSPQFDKIAVGNNSSRLLGYAPRYYEYKTTYDEVHGMFKSSYKNWVAPVDDTYIMHYLGALGNVPLNTDLINYIFFKINPSVLNDIFASDVSSSQDSDQFIVNAYFDAKAVRNLDRNGLPY